MSASIRPHQASPAAPAWRATLAQTAMELRLTARRGENLLVTLVVPVVLLLFFASTQIVPASAGRPADFLVPGILALAVISTSMVNLGIATAFERHYGVLKRLGGSPLTRGGLLAAKVLTILVVEVAQVVLVAGIAAVAFGWAPGSGWQPAVVLVALLLGTAAFAAIGLGMAGGLRAEATLAGANGLYLVLLLLGGVVLPIDHLPGPLPTVAQVLPAAPLSESLRIGLGAATVGSGAGSTTDPLGPLLLLAGWAIVVGVITARTFSWE